MIIKKVYSKRLKREVWSINVRIGTIRYREARWDRKADAEEYVAQLKRAATIPHSIESRLDRIESKIDSILTRPTSR